jgi:hypothetical protein
MEEAKTFVEVTVVALSQVPVAPVNVIPCKPVWPVTVREERLAFVPVRLVAKRLVEVVFVPVAFTQMRSWTVSGAVTVRLPMVAFWANRLVEVELVEVVFVKTPVEGTRLPIWVPFTEPPEMVALEDERVGAVRLLMVPERAYTLVPEATLKPNQEVLVPFTKVRSVEPSVWMVPLVEKRLVEVESVNEASWYERVVPERYVTVPVVEERVWMVPEMANRSVVVAYVVTRLVPVAFPQVRLAKYEGWVEETIRFVTVRLVKVAFVAVRSVTFEVWTVWFVTYWFTVVEFWKVASVA